MPDDFGVTDQPEPMPNKAQQEALEALRQTRELGRSSALVVMAPGLGKTHLAAWDANRIARDGHVLYLALRDEHCVQPSNRKGDRARLSRLHRLQSLLRHRRG